MSADAAGAARRRSLSWRNEPPRLAPPSAQEENPSGMPPLGRRPNAPDRDQAPAACSLASPKCRSRSDPVIGLCALSDRSTAAHDRRFRASLRHRPPRDARRAHFRLGLDRGPCARDRRRCAPRVRRRLGARAAGELGHGPRRRRARASDAAARALLRLRGDGLRGQAADPPARARARVRRRQPTRRSTSRDRSTRDRAEARKWRELRWLAGAAWRRLRQGDFRGIVRRMRAQNYTAPSLDDPDIVAALAPQLSPGRPLTVALRPQHGGRRQSLSAHADRRARSRPAAPCCSARTTCPRSTIVLTLHAHGTPRSGRFGSRHSSCSKRLFERMPVAELFVNSPVSFDEPLLFAEWVARLRRAHPATRLVVTAHDYFSVCPSFVLLDADGRYCGVPDLDVCARCLPRHRASYVTLSPPTTIPEWRASWGRCLAAADEIRCFSESTRDAPAPRPSRRSTPPAHRRPARLDYRPERRPALRHADAADDRRSSATSARRRARSSCATCSRGSSAIIPDADRRRSARSTSPSTRPASHVTGPYRRDDLVDLIESHGINMILFPSICPETFSYVIEEMMLLRMPIVAFDLGAPGERLRSYELGRLCPSVDAAAALAAMVDFHDELATRETATRVSAAMPDALHVFTCAAVNYLPKVRILCRSLRQHHPEAVIHVALADERPDWLDVAGEPFDRRDGDRRARHSELAAVDVHAHASSSSRPRSSRSRSGACSTCTECRNGPLLRSRHRAVLARRRHPRDARQRPTSR